MSPKVSGSWNLHTLTRDLPLDFFVMFSSIVSVLGSSGQANHASACAFQDGLSYYRRARGLPALSINWGPWSTVGAVVNHHVGDRLKSRGLLPISPAEGIQVTELLLGRHHEQVVVLRADWSKFMGQYQAEQNPSILSELTVKVQARPKGPSVLKKPVLLPQLEKASHAEGRKLLQTHVREVIIQVLGLEPSFFIDPQQGLRDIGMDSLMSLELRNRLQSSIGQSLPSTLAFDFPTMGALVDFLAGKALKRESVSDVNIHQYADKRAKDVAQLDELSDKEAEALLLEELAKQESRKS
jgi:acyl carrier protein